MIAGLREAGIEVIECHVPLWKGIEDRVQTASGGWANFAFIKRIWSTYAQLLTQYLALDKDYDLMVLGYPGQLDVFLARLLTWLQGKPLVLDLFMSIYLIAVERELADKSNLTIRLIRWLEWLACRWPNLLICDTQAYVDWHVKTHGLSPDKFRLVPTGADNRIFKPDLTGFQNLLGLNVLYYGTFIPNHGVETIIEAANLLKAQPNIHFELIGDGPTKANAQQLAQHYGLKNVSFIDWLDQTALSQKVAEADILLGVFGTTPQSLMTIQNKIYEGLAMKKAIITGDSPTIRETFRHQEHLYLVERCQPTALVEAILTLQANPKLRSHLAEMGHTKVAREFTVAALGQRFRQHLEEIIKP